MIPMTLLSDVTSDALTLAELKFSREKWRKWEFDPGLNVENNYKGNPTFPQHQKIYII